MINRSEDVPYMWTRFLWRRGEDEQEDEDGEEVGEKKKYDH